MKPTPKQEPGKTNHQPRTTRYGFTFVELIVSCVILVIFWVSFLTAFNNLLKTAEYSQAFSYASTACRNKLEEMLAHDFNTLRQDYDPSGSPGGTPFDVNFPAITGITGKGYIKIIDRPEYYGGSPGKNWTLATEHANWPGRQGFTALVYPLTGPDSKMWVMGGHAAKNDVWWSINGINWTCVTSHANWPGRQGFTALVYPLTGPDSKMWVMGGVTSAFPLLIHNDVWYSTDGSSWHCPTSNAAWSKRSNHTSLVYDNKMWIIGGVESDGTNKNDVWSSTDGVTWTCATATAAWPERFGHSSLVYPLNGTDAMWVLGGFNSVSGDLPGVWYSTDPEGKIWTCATDNAGWAPYVHSSLVYNDKMWIMGGGSRNDVWWSKDGANWTCVTSNAEWTARSSHSSLVYNDKMWIMGGSAPYPIDELNDVWYSAGYDRLLEVIITVSWKTRDGRVFGEQDTDGDGILDPAEDKNDNGAWDSPVQLRTLVSERNIPHIQKVFLGRP